MRRSSPPFALVAVVLAAAAATPRAVGAERGQPAPGEPGEIGAACVDCHEDVVASYRETGMARALELLSEGEPERLAQLEPVEEPGTGLRYRFEREGDRARILESRGERELGSAEVAFAVGAGLMDRAFAVERGGALWFAPLEVMTTARGHASVLAPALEQAPGTRLGHPITGECLGCHTDRLPLQDYPLNVAPRGYAPRGVGCAACHGDVDAHVAWREADLSGEQPAGRDEVVTSRSLDREQRMSVCARCHLQGDARIAFVRGERGIPPAGDDVLQHIAVWTAPPGTEEIGFVSHVERLVQSPCYLETASWGGRALACESCHDPHRSGFEAAERARVRAACGRCHGARGEPSAATCSRAHGEDDRGRDCAACHMRRTPVFDLFHVEIHDHFIRRDPPPPSAFARIRGTQTLTPELERFAWPGAAPAPHVDDPGLLMMALTAAGQRAAALELADERPERAVFRLPMYHHLRGTLLEEAGRLEDARVAYERALVLDPGQVETVVNLGPVLARLGRGDEALAALDQVVADHPDAEGALRNRAVVRAALGDMEGAAVDLEAAHRILPRGETARVLAEVRAGLGDEERAAAWRLEAERLDGR